MHSIAYARVLASIMSSPSKTTNDAKQRDDRFRDLVDMLLSDSPAKFDPFIIHRAVYSSDDIDIGVDVLLPKSMKSTGPRPVIIRIHGGFLITGSSLFPAWFTKWILDYAELHEAVIVSPNYRLLPEVRGVDILKDMENFWSWMRNEGVESWLRSRGIDGVQLDLERQLVVGESAGELTNPDLVLYQLGMWQADEIPSAPLVGGYLALQSSLLRFANPRALILAYPMIDLEAPHYTQAADKVIVGVPNFPDKFIDDFLDLPHKQEFETEADPPDRLALALATVQNGRFLDFLGKESQLFPLRTLEAGCDEKRPILPPCFILHGEDDSAVPAEGTKKFVKKLKACSPLSVAHLALRPGDHGFDSSAKLSDDWLAQGLRHVTGPWLR